MATTTANGPGDITNMSTTGGPRGEREDHDAAISSPKTSSRPVIQPLNLKKPRPAEAQKTTKAGRTATSTLDRDTAKPKRLVLDNNDNTTMQVHPMTTTSLGYDQDPATAAEQTLSSNIATAAAPSSQTSSAAARRQQSPSRRSRSSRLSSHQYSATAPSSPRHNIDMTLSPESKGLGGVGANNYSRKSSSYSRAHSVDYQGYNNNNNSYSTSSVDHNGPKSMHYNESPLHTPGRRPSYSHQRHSSTSSGRRLSQYTFESPKIGSAPFTYSPENYNIDDSHLEDDHHGTAQELATSIGVPNLRMASNAVMRANLKTGDPYDELSRFLDNVNGMLSSLTLSIPHLQLLCDRYRSIQEKLLEYNALVEVNRTQEEVLEQKEQQILSLKDKLNQMTSMHSAEGIRLRNKIGSLEAEIRIFNDIITSKNRELDELAARFEEEKELLKSEREQWGAANGDAFLEEKLELLEKHDAEIEILEEGHQEKIKEIEEAHLIEKQKMIDTYEATIKNFAESHQAELDDILQKKSDEINEIQRLTALQLETNQASKMTALKESHTAEMRSLESRFYAKLETLKVDVGKRRVELERTHAKEKKMQEEEFEKERAGWIAEKEQLKGQIQYLQYEKNTTAFTHEAEKNSLIQMVEDSERAVQKLEKENERVSGVLKRIGEADLGQEIKGRGDGFYIDAFTTLTKDIIDISSKFLDLPRIPPGDVISEIPSALPNILSDTDSSRLLRQAYIQHVISSILCKRIFSPFLFSLANRYDNADSLLKAMSSHLRKKSTRREAIWRNYTLMAGYTANSAKAHTASAAAKVIDEIIEKIKPFAEQENMDRIFAGVRRVVKYAVDTWRYARLEKEMFVVRVEGESGGGFDWGRHLYETQLPYVTDGRLVEAIKASSSSSVSASEGTNQQQPQTKRKLVLHLLPLIYREGTVPSITQPDAVVDDGRVFTHGIALFSDCLPILHRRMEVAENGPPSHSHSSSPAGGRKLEKKSDGETSDSSLRKELEDPKARGDLGRVAAAAKEEARVKHEKMRLAKAKEEERLKAEREEFERVRKQKEKEKEREEREREEMERKEEEMRIKAQHEELERIRKEKARVKAEQEAFRVREEARIKVEREEAERRELVRIEAEREEQERLMEQARIKAEREEAEREEAERVEAERRDHARIEAERERRALARIKAEREEQERLEKEVKIRSEIEEIERKEASRLQVLREKQERLEKEARLRAEREREEAEAREAALLESMEIEALIRFEENIRFTEEAEAQLAAENKSREILLQEAEELAQMELEAQRADEEAKEIALRENAEYERAMTERMLLERVEAEIQDAEDAEEQLIAEGKQRREKLRLEAVAKAAEDASLEKERLRVREERRKELRARIEAEVAAKKMERERERQRSKAEAEEKIREVEREKERLRLQAVAEAEERLRLEPEARKIQGKKLTAEVEDAEEEEEEEEERNSNTSRGVVEEADAHSEVMSDAGVSTLGRGIAEAASILSMGTENFFRGTGDSEVRGVVPRSLRRPDTISEGPGGRFDGHHIVHMRDNPEIMLTDGEREKKHTSSVVNGGPKERKYTGSPVDGGREKKHSISPVHGNRERKHTSPPVDEGASMIWLKLSEPEAHSEVDRVPERDTEEPAAPIHAPKSDSIRVPTPQRTVHNRSISPLKNREIVSIATTSSFKGESDIESVYSGLEPLGYGVGAVDRVIIGQEGDVVRERSEKPVRLRGEIENEDGNSVYSDTGRTYLSGPEEESVDIDDESFDSCGADVGEEDDDESDYDSHEIGMKRKSYHRSLQDHDDDEDDEENARNTIVGEQEDDGTTEVALPPVNLEGETPGGVELAKFDFGLGTESDAEDFGIIDHLNWNEEGGESLHHGIAGSSGEEEVNEFQNRNGHASQPGHLDHHPDHLEQKQHTPEGEASFITFSAPKTPPPPAHLLSRGESHDYEGTEHRDQLQEKNHERGGYEEIHAAEHEKLATRNQGEQHTESRSVHWRDHPHSEANSHVGGGKEGVLEEEHKGGQGHAQNDQRGESREGAGFKGEDVMAAVMEAVPVEFEGVEQSGGIDDRHFESRDRRLGENGFVDGRQHEQYESENNEEEEQRHNGEDDYESYESDYGSHYGARTELNFDYGSEEEEEEPEEEDSEEEVEDDREDLSRSMQTLEEDDDDRAVEANEIEQQRPVGVAQSTMEDNTIDEQMSSTTTHNAVDLDMDDKPRNRIRDMENEKYRGISSRDSSRQDSFVANNVNNDQNGDDGDGRVLQEAQYDSDDENNRFDTFTEIHPLSDHEELVAHGGYGGEEEEISDDDRCYGDSQVGYAETNGESQVGYAETYVEPSVGTGYEHGQESYPSRSRSRSRSQSRQEVGGSEPDFGDEKNENENEAQGFEDIGQDHHHHLPQQQQQQLQQSDNNPSVKHEKQPEKSEIGERSLSSVESSNGHGGDNFWKIWEEENDPDHVESHEELHTDSQKNQQQHEEENNEVFFFPGELSGDERDIQCQDQDQDRNVHDDGYGDESDHERSSAHGERGGREESEVFLFPGELSENEAVKQDQESDQEDHERDKLHQVQDRDLHDDSAHDRSNLHDDHEESEVFLLPGELTENEAVTENQNQESDQESDHELHQTQGRDLHDDSVHDRSSLHGDHEESEVFLFPGELSESEAVTQDQNRESDQESDHELHQIQDRDLHDDSVHDRSSLHGDHEESEVFLFPGELSESEAVTQDQNQESDQESDHELHQTQDRDLHDDSVHDRSSLHGDHESEVFLFPGELSESEAVTQDQNRESDQESDHERNKLHQTQDRDLHDDSVHDRSNLHDHEESEVFFFPGELSENEAVKQDQEGDQESDHERNKLHQVQDWDLHDGSAHDRSNLGDDHDESEVFLFPGELSEDEFDIQGQNQFKQGQQAQEEEEEQDEEEQQEGTNHRHQGPARDRQDREDPEEEHVSDKGGVHERDQEKDEEYVEYRAGIQTGSDHDEEDEGGYRNNHNHLRTQGEGDQENHQHDEDGESDHKARYNHKDDYETDPSEGGDDDRDISGHYEEHERDQEGYHASEDEDEHGSWKGYHDPDPHEQEGHLGSQARDRDVYSEQEEEKTTAKAHEDPERQEYEVHSDFEEHAYSESGREHDHDHGDLAQNQRHDSGEYSAVQSDNGSQRQVGSGYGDQQNCVGDGGEYEKLNEHEDREVSVQGRNMGKDEEHGGHQEGHEEHPEHQDEKGAQKRDAERGVEKDVVSQDHVERDPEHDKEQHKKEAEQNDEHEEKNEDQYRDFHKHEGQHDKPHEDPKGEHDIEHEKHDDKQDEVGYESEHHVDEHHTEQKGNQHEGQDEEQHEEENYQGKEDEVQRDAQQNHEVQHKENHDDMEQKEKQHEGQHQEGPHEEQHMQSQPEDKHIGLQDDHKRLEQEENSQEAQPPVESEDHQEPNNKQHDLKEQHEAGNYEGHHEAQHREQQQVEGHKEHKKDGGEYHGEQHPEERQPEEHGEQYTEQTQEPDAVQQNRHEAQGGEPHEEQQEEGMISARMGPGRRIMKGKGMGSRRMNFSWKRRN